MRMKKASFIFLCLVACNYALNWEYCVNGPTLDQNYLFQTVELPSTELVSIGYTSSGFLESYLWILRTDSLGTIISNKEWRNASQALPISADTNAAGSIGITGTNNLILPSAFFALYQPDIDTLQIWIFEATDTSLEGYAIAPTPDSGFVFACCGNTETSDFLRLIKVAPPDWDVQWQKDFYLPERLFFWNICCDDDACFNLVGYLHSLNYGLFFRFTPDGDSILTTEFPTGYLPTCIEKAHTEGYIISGEYAGCSWIAKIDSTGGIIWSRIFEYSSFDFMNSTKISSERYAFVGVKREIGGDHNLAILLIDSLSDSLCCFVYGSPMTTERGRGIWPCVNGDLIACGMADIDGHWNGLILRRELFDTFAVGEELFTPEAFNISAFPNPFNSAVTIALDAPVGAHGRAPLQIEIFDISGRRIAQLPDGGFVGAGFTPALNDVADNNERDGARPSPTTREFTWTPDETLPSGVYLVRARVDSRSLSGGYRAEPMQAEAGDGVATKRVVYLK